VRRYVGRRAALGRCRLGGHRRDPRLHRRLAGWEIKALLIGESARDRTVSEIRQLASAQLRHLPRQRGAHHARRPEYVLVNLSVDLHDGIDLAEVEISIARLDLSIKQQFPRVKRIFVEAEARRQAVDAG